MEKYWNIEGKIDMKVLIAKEKMMHSRLPCAVFSGNDTSHFLHGRYVSGLLLSLPPPSSLMQLISRFSLWGVSRVDSMAVRPWVDSKKNKKKHPKNPVHHEAIPGCQRIIRREWINKSCGCVCAPGWDVCCLDRAVGHRSKYNLLRTSPNQPLSIIAGESDDLESGYSGGPPTFRRCCQTAISKYTQINCARKAHAAGHHLIGRHWMTSSAPFPLHPAAREKYTNRTGAEDSDVASARASRL